MKKRPYAPAAAPALALALALALGAASCSGDDAKDGTVAVTGVEVFPKDLSLVAGYTAGLTAADLAATVRPPDATDGAVAWESSDTGVVEVVGAGGLDAAVTAVGPGEAVITVRTNDGGKFDTCGVSVAPYVAVTGVTLDKTKMDLWMFTGAPTPMSDTLVATVEPPDATDKAVTWASSAPGVAAVVGMGGPNATVTAVTPSNIAIITVRTNDGRRTATCTVFVGPVE
jgi:uncharacterized protein YjdB